MPTNIKESGFESLIVNWLVEQNGYEQGATADYNKEYAVDETRLFRFLQDTQPEQLEKLGIRKSHQKYAQFLNRLQGEISKRGIVDVLRNGIKVYPADLIMFYLTPSEGNAKAKELFQKNFQRHPTTPLFTGCSQTGTGSVRIYQWPPGYYI